MKERNRISDGLVENMRNWYHSGFSVHNEVVIQKEDREALGRLADVLFGHSLGQGREMIFQAAADHSRRTSAFLSGKKWVTPILIIRLLQF